MAVVYGSATLTIAINTKQNLFDPVFAEQRSYVPQDAPTEWVTQYKRYCFENSASEIFAFHNFKRYLYTGGIIGARAWCLQERQLSPRMMHLIDNSIILWECSSLRASNATPEHFSFIEKRIALKLCQDIGDNMAMHQRYVDGAFYRRDGDSFPDLTNHLYFWHIMLRDMGYRSLTCSSDNLIAIAGIAAQFQYNTGLTYLSGIWKEDIPRGLLWMRTPEQELSYNRQWKRFSDYQGPSWSWCSVDGPTQLIEYNTRTQMPMDVREERVSDQTWVNMIHDIEIHGFQDSAISEQLRYLQRESYLSIKGYLGRFQCSGEEVTLSQCAGKDRFSYTRDLGGGTNLFDLSQIEQAPGNHVKGAAVFDIPEECTERKLWCLFLAKASEEPGRFGVALVLEPIPDLFKASTQLNTNHAGSMDETWRPRDFRRIGLAFLQLQHSNEWIQIWTKYLGEKAQLHIF